MRVIDQHVIGTALAPFEDQTPLVVNSPMPGAVALLQIVTDCGLEGAASSWAETILRQPPPFDDSASH